jgi:uroporphyrinogen decarboxylase
MASLERICQAVGDLVNIGRLRDDLRINPEPQISPQLFRHFFKPRHILLCETIFVRCSMHILLYSCGSIYRLISDRIKAGFKVLSPVQTDAREMQPERLKREFGFAVPFWSGGADTRSVLNFGMPVGPGLRARQ